MFGSTQAPSPDVYRGKYRADHPDPATAYAEEVNNILNNIQKKGRKVQFVSNESADSSPQCFSTNQGT